MDTIGGLLKVTKYLNEDVITNEDLDFIYKSFVSVDITTLNLYYNTKNVKTYDNGLILYLAGLNTLKDIFEETEEYEKCHQIKLSKGKAMEVYKNNTIKNTK